MSDADIEILRDALRYQDETGFEAALDRLSARLAPVDAAKLVGLSKAALYAAAKGYLRELTEARARIAALKKQILATELMLSDEIRDAMANPGGGE